MKVKLLKKLRKRFVIYERNGEYRLHDLECNVRIDIFFTSQFRDGFKLCKEKRRDCILTEAKRYWEPKKEIR